MRFVLVLLISVFVFCHRPCIPWRKFLSYLFAFKPLFGLSRINSYSSFNDFTLILIKTFSYRWSKKNMQNVRKYSNMCFSKSQFQTSVFEEGKKKFWRKTWKSFFLPYSWYGKAKKKIEKGRY